jgi:trigger factor
LNVQTEHLEENHRVRFTVSVEAERFNKSKKKAARQIAKQVNIPGFRKGKAPYHILVRSGLERHIVEDAIEELSQTIYREMLEQSDVEPYGPGAFEDFKLEEENPVFVYTVPLMPVAKLGDYRSVRQDYEEPELSDEDMEKAMERLARQQAVVEDSQEPVRMGNRVTVDLHSIFADDPPENDDEETTAPARGENFAHEHGAEIELDPDNPPLLPGFAEELVGANIEDELDFELTIPEDSEDYELIAGRKIAFNVVIENIEVVTVPELNDDFAANLTEDDEDGPLTLLQLRMKVRENLLKRMKEITDQEYVSDVLSTVVDISEISFPDVMIEDQIDVMIEEFESRLHQQGMDLQTFYQVTENDEEGLREEYKEPAIASIKRTLALRKIIEAEELSVEEAQIDAHIDEMVVQFGPQAEAIRSMFDSPEIRTNIVNDLLLKRVNDRLVAIARGEDPPVGNPPQPVTEADSDTEDKVEIETQEASEVETVEEPTSEAEEE